MAQTEAEVRFSLPFTLTADEYAEALRTIVKAARGKPIQRTRRLHDFGQYAIHVAYGLVIFAVLLNYLHRDWVIAGFIAVAFAALYAFALNCSFQWTDAWLGFTFDPMRHGEGTAIFGASEARLIGPAHEQAWNWALLRRLHATPDLHIAEFAGTEMLVIPRRAFASPDEERDWTEFIKRLLPPEL